MAVRKRAKGPKKDGDAASQRARAKAEKRSRVWEAGRLMARGEYVTGQTDKELAAKWGVAVNTAQHITAEASRTIQIVSDGGEELKRLLSARLAEIQDENGPDRVQAIKVLFDAFGFITRQHKVEVSNAPRNETQALAELMADPVWGPKIRAYVTTGEPVPELPAGEKDEESE